MGTSRRVELVFLVFMVSGFGGLIYESVWTHYLQLFLGHSAYAQTLVLVVFIGGLAGGAWTASRFGERLANPLRVYAAVELAIGLIALVFHPIFVAATDWAYAVLLPATCEASRSFCAGQWLLSALLLLPQSLLLGATFPLVSSAVLRMDPSSPGRHVATLYFLNSLGAVFGVLASAFVLIPAVGLPGTLTFAGAANLAIAAAALLLSMRRPPAFALPPAEAPSTEAPGEGPRIVSALLVTAFLTGLSSFIYEIAWVRMLSLVLGASTYSFELMLASFILGLALGGLWVRRRVDETGDPVRFLAVVQLVMGVAAAATLPLYNGSFGFMAWLISALARNSAGFVFFNLGSTAIALLVMLPATVCAGMTLPLITYRLLRSPSGERALGLVYSVNTLGSIAGVVICVHLLMTTLGVRGALLTGAAIDVGLGVVLIALRRPAAVAPFAGTGVALAGVVALVAIAIAFPLDVRRSAAGVFRTGQAMINSNATVSFHKDGKTATVDVIDEGGVRAIRTNGKSDAAIELGSGPPTFDELTMAMLAIAPLGHRPGAKNAAIIGFGSGMSTDVMLRSPNIESVDTIEIEPAMVEGARRFLPAVSGAFSDPRSHVVIDDAKSYFARGGKRYDIIVSEPSNPWVSGVASLFTEEFYRRLARSLKDGGVLAQWVHTYEIDAEALSSIFNAVSLTFPQFVVYGTNVGDIVIIARKGGPVGRFDDQVLRWPAMAPIVQRLNLGDPAVVHRHTLGTAATVLAVYRGLGERPNSDFHPIVEQRTSRTRFTRDVAKELGELQGSPMPLLEMFDGSFRPAAHAIPGPTWSVSDRAAVDAWQIHDVILSPEAPESAPPPGGESLEHSTRLVALWARGCPAGIPFDRLLPSLAKIAEIINPQLDRASALEVWRHIADSPCAKRLAPAERRWLALFSAVASRDPDAMASLGAEILDANRASRGALVEYGFEATVTGLVCRGRTAEADRYFNEGTRHWLAPGTAPVTLRYLYAIAHTPPHIPRPGTDLCPAGTSAGSPSLTPDATRSRGSADRSRGR